MTKYFKNKQEYKNFKAAWAIAVNSPKAKSSFIPCYEYIRNSSTDTYNVTKEKTGKRYNPGWISSSHMLLFNILTNKPLTTGFNILTNKTKKQNGLSPYDGVIKAVYNLNSILRCCKHILFEPEQKLVIAKKLKDPFNNSEPLPSFDKLSYNQKKIFKFLEPFNGTVTIETLLMVSNISIKSVISQELGEDIF